ncbi:MAG: metallophosphoesterase [Bacteroidales bacterium]|jgi:predicted phosphodiesterase|nr:metallophosphoesterase [Bacteroidales bacterium]
MYNFLKKGGLIIVAFSFFACSDGDMLGFFVSQSGGVDNRTEYSLLQNSETGVQIFTTESETYTLCLVGDTHIGNAENILKMEQIVRDSVMAIIILGDISTGKESDMLIAADFVNNSPTPVVTLIGNHDLFFNGWELFKKLFGSSVFYFEVHTPSAKDLHICLDSGNGMLGKKQYDWLQNVLKTKRGTYRHCVVYTHVNLFRTNHSQLGSANMPLEETYQLMHLLSSNHVNFVFMGHDHYREELTQNQVRYITLDALSNEKITQPSYVILSVNEAIHYQFEDL